MSEPNPQSYLFLIQELLRCLSGSEQAILDANSDLVDDGLVSMMQDMVQMYEQMQDRETVNALRRLIQLVSKRNEPETVTKPSRNLSADIDSSDSTPANEASSSIPQTDETAFIQEILPLILQGGGDLEKTMQLIFKSFAGQLDPASFQQLQSAILGSSGNPQALINQLLQSGFMGQANSESAQTMQTLMNNLSQRGQTDSLQESIFRTIEEMLQLAKEKGKSEEVESFIYPLQELSKVWGVSSSYDTVESPVVDSHNTLLQMAFLKIAQTKQEGKSHEQIYSEISPLLKANIDKLNDELPHLLQVWAETLPRGTTDQAKQFAAAIFLLGESVVKFPLGSVATNIEIAISAYEVALQFFKNEDEPELWASVQGSLGNAYLARIRGDKAENIEKSILAQQAALRNFPLPKSLKEWVSTQIHLSNAYRDRIREDKAENIELAIAAAKEGLKAIDRAESPQEWATVQKTLGNAYGSRIKGDNAENQELALDAYKKALEVHTPNSNAERWAGIQNNLAHVYRKRTKGNHAENLELAIKACEEAMSAQTLEENPQRWAMVQTTLGTTYYDRIRGDRFDNLKLAIKAYARALKVFTFETFPEQWARTHSNLAAGYFACAQRFTKNRHDYLELVISSCQSALEVYTIKAFPERWATTNIALANAYSQRINGDRAENLELAITTYNAALEVSTREALPQSWALIQLNLSNAYHYFNQEGAENLELAIKAGNAALEVYTRDSFPSLWAMSQNNLGIIYTELGEIEAAIKALRLALKVHTPQTNPIDCFKHGNNLGRAAMKIKRWSEAIDGFSVAVEAVEQSRAWTTFDLRKQEIISEAIKVYFGIVEAYFKNNQPDKALEYVERSKARNLVELLSNRDRSPKGDFPESVSDKLKQLQREIVAEQRRLEIIEDRFSLLIPGIDDRVDYPENESSDRHRQYLNELQKQLDDLITKSIDPIDSTFRVTQQVKAISFEQIRSLIDDGTTIIEWYITSNDCYTFAINSNWENPRVWSSTAINNKTIQDLNDWFSRYFQDYQNDKNHWRDNLSELLQQLTQILNIENILNSLPTSCDRLILIPHRFLHLIPLHALSLSDGNYLLDRFPGGVNYAPSCQFLQFAQKLDRAKLKNLVAIQNPTKDLFYADLEVDAIQRFFSPEHTDILKESNATKELIERARLESCHFLHFICHGYFNITNPRKSALSLANAHLKSVSDELNSEQHLSLQDGTTLDLNQCLTLDDIFNLNLDRCLLVILSACETGLIDFQNLSDEYIGLPSSFLYAGSANVISSLWSVSDISTALIIAKFYENLQNQPSVALAINQAQCWLRDATGNELNQWIEKNQFSLSGTLKISLRRQFNKDKYPFRSPYYWAAFCAVG